MDGRHSPRDTHTGSGVWQGGHGEGTSRATSPKGPPQRSPFLSQGKGCPQEAATIWPLSHPLALEPAGRAPCTEMCVRVPGLTHGRSYTILQAVRF